MKYYHGTSGVVHLQTWFKYSVPRHIRSSRGAAGRGSRWAPDRRGSTGPGGSSSQCRRSRPASWLWEGSKMAEEATRPATDCSDSWILRTRGRKPRLVGRPAVTWLHHLAASETKPPFFRFCFREEGRGTFMG